MLVAADLPVNQKITFPTPFSEVPVTVIAHSGGNDSEGRYDQLIVSQDKTWVQGMSNTLPVGYNVQIIAIGKYAT